MSDTNSIQCHSNTARAEGTSAAQATGNPGGELSRVEVWTMFDRLAPSYDRLNRVLSLRFDVAWRRKMAKFLPESGPLRLLDLATGTGDQIFFLLDRTDRVEEALGLDLSEGMLAVGHEKVKRLSLGDRVRLDVGDANEVPVPPASFDVVTISFGIRNVTDVQRSLTNMYRALRPGGRVLVLEATVPKWRLLRWPYLVYFRHVLPVIGGWVSGDRKAYQYLNKTVETFPARREFVALLEGAGFENGFWKELTFGTAILYVADKPGGSLK